MQRKKEEMRLLQRGKENGGERDIFECFEKFAGILRECANVGGKHNKTLRTSQYIKLI